MSKLKFKVHTFLSLAALTLSLPAFAADKKVVAETKPVVETKPVNASAIKIAYINSPRVLQESPAAQKVLQEIQKAEAELNKKVQVKREEMKKAQEAKKSETELQMLAEKMKLELEPEAKKIQEDAAQKTGALETKLMDTIKVIAEQGKYDYVLIKDAVLYGGADITDEVIKKLN